MKISEQLQDPTDRYPQAITTLVLFLFSACYKPLTPPACSANAWVPSPRELRERGWRSPGSASVVYRRGELSKATIDRDWPHQVALPAYRCTGGNFVTIPPLLRGSVAMPARAFLLPRRHGRERVLLRGARAPRAISRALRRRVHRSEGSAKMAWLEVVS